MMDVNESPSGPEAPAAEPARLGALRSWRWVRMWLVLLLPAWLFGAASLYEAGSLWTLAEGPSPYFRTDQAFLLYLEVPIAVLSGLALFLLPGRLLAERSASPTDPSFGLRQFGWALTWNAGLVFAAALIDPQGWRLGKFALVALVACLPLVVLRAVRPSRSVREATVRPPDGLAWFLPVGLACIALGPKLWWESFNGDGAHAFAVTRVLLEQATPFLPADAGPISRFPGMTSFAFTYPGAFFLRLFGEGEGPMRIQVFLYLIGLHAAVKAVAAEGRVAVSGRLRDVLLAALCGVYLLAMAFSATYSPYHADLALPATQDTLLMAAFLGFVWASLTGRRGWMVLFALWTYTSLPSGLLLIAAWVGARWLVTRPRPWRESVEAGGALVVAAVLVSLTASAFVALELPTPGAEYGSGGLVKRLTRLQFTDVGRALYAAVPAGLVPFAALFAWRRQDGAARAITLVALGYFLLFYVQGYISLHHFVPAMVLPWVVFLRLPGWADEAAATKLAGAGAAGVLVAAILAWPANTTPSVDAKEVALSVRHAPTRHLNKSEHVDLSRLPGPAHRPPVSDVAAGPDVYRNAALMLGRFPRPYAAEVPAEAFGVADPVWSAYFTLPHLRRGPPTYGIEKRPGPLPEPSRFERPEEAAGLDFALLVLDEAQARTDRERRPATDRTAPLLRVDRGILYKGLPRDGGPRIFHLLPTLRRWKARLTGGGAK